MATVNPLTLGERLRVLKPQLEEADRRLAEAIERIEDLFELHLPEDAYGRILVERPYAKLGGSGEWVHIIFEEGVLWVETWSPKRGFHFKDLTKWDVRAHKIEACRRVRDLWIACGGDQDLVGP